MSYQIDYYSLQAKKVGEEQLDSAIFSMEKANNDVLQQYVVMYRANQRTSTAHTKTRAEVDYSGRKLYRQKGSGGARPGDAGSPIRKKGGVAFGPRNEANYQKSMPKKMKQLALITAMLHKADDQTLKGLKGVEGVSKTKAVASFLSGVDCLGSKCLFVTPAGEYAMFARSVANIPGVDVTHVGQLSAYDIINTSKVFFVDTALSDLSKKLSS